MVSTASFVITGALLIGSSSTSLAIDPKDPDVIHALDTANRVASNIYKLSACDQGATARYSVKADGDRLVVDVRPRRTGLEALRVIVNRADASVVEIQRRKT